MQVSFSKVVEFSPRCRRRTMPKRGEGGRRGKDWGGGGGGRVLLCWQCQGGGPPTTFSLHPTTKKKLRGKQQHRQHGTPVSSSSVGLGVCDGGWGSAGHHQDRWVETGRQMFSLSQEPKRRVFTHTFMHAENKNSVSSITLRRGLGKAKMIRQNKTILKVPLLRPWVLVRTKITCKI